jgi:oligopeptide transport system ATP-binding protein
VEVSALSVLLKVKNLSVSFFTLDGEVKAARNVSFELGERETLAIVGESGCGKTVATKSILRLHDRSGGVIKKGSEILFNGKNLITMSKKELNKIRGNDISMIFQDSMTSLNPTTTIGKQIAEALVIHKLAVRSKALLQAKKLLTMVNLPDVDERIKNYPHQLSGGMRQRVMIAMAIACNPKILIADEPTTALDVTVQAQILDLLRELRENFGMSVILVTHDFGVVADFADRIIVMYAGSVIERGTKAEILQSPKHPYTWALLNSIPGRSAAHKGELYSIKGTPPDLLLPLNECPFSARCEYCMSICKRERPEEKVLTETHGVSCWLSHELAPAINMRIQTGAENDEHPNNTAYIGTKS